ncbi:MAG: HAMP domain-containing sensor histidine kinase [Arachidicoccus sp.]|nr:HAMP domain-containing sensor histidine kinase [Arachidicoccus sp.]
MAKFSGSFQRTLFTHGYLLIIAAWLFTISFVINNYWAFTSTPDKVQNNFENYLSAREKKFENITQDKNALSVLFTNGSDKSGLDISDNDFGLFVFSPADSGILHKTYWSTFNMSIDAKDVQVPDGYYPYHGSNGYFELLKKNIIYKHTAYVVAALIPIKWQYFIHNKYFTNSFANNAVLDNRYFIDTANTGLPVYNTKHKPVFNISQIPGSESIYPNLWAVVIRVLGMLFVLIFINSAINDITAINGFYIGAFWLLVIVVFLRIITYLFPLPLNLHSYELFSPLIYSSGVLHSSLGDLLINTLLFFWLTFFIKYRYNIVPENGVPPVFSKYKKVWAVVLLFLFSFFTVNAINIICSLVLDSKIPLNVTDFFHLNKYTLITFIILTFLILSYYNLSHFLTVYAKKVGFDLYFRIMIVCVSSLLILSVFHHQETIKIQLFGVIWTSIYCFILEFRKDDLPKPLVNSSYFLFWLMFYAASITLIISSVQTKDRERKMRIADDIALQAGNEAESLLKMAVGNFRSFIYYKNFNRFYNPADNSFLKDSLIANNFKGFLNKYNSRVYTFDSLQNPLYNSDSASFNVLNVTVGAKGKSTNIQDLYVYETQNSEFNYIYRTKIGHTGKDSSVLPLGYLFLVVNPKRFTGNTFPTELLQESALLSNEANQTYSYAIYKNRRLIFNTNDFEFSDSLTNSQIPTGEYREANNSHKKEFWYKADNSTIIVLIEDNNSFIAAITLFAYIFLSSVFLIVFFKITGFIIQSRFRWDIIKIAFQFKIKFQIHATIIFISIFSFVIIGISTISFFISRFNKSNQEKITQNLNVVGNEVQESLNATLPFSLQTPNDLDKYYSSDFVEKRIVEIASLNNIEVNYYDKTGTLQATSQPYIYNKNLVSNKMNPDAYYQMYNKHRIILLQKETIGKFNYLSGYIPLYDNNNAVFGFLNIPFLHSQSELEQEISSFLVTVINLNALIFLIAGAIAGLLTLRITRSFADIKNEMSKINLGMENKELEWKKNDEIGDLVKEYNVMVHKLNESVKRLAQSEREGAWKEMAMQVAHEIKNPLTPMKLNLQFLQRSAEKGGSEILDLSRRVPEMLIEQIDQLAKIANDFSQFADIHNTQPERIELTNKLNNVIMLFNAYENIKIHFRPSPEKNIIYADKKQLNRVFTNLIKNAIEASDDNFPIEIFIKEENAEHEAIVSIKDNGQGIAADKKDKIFVPNFTTKTSGTGLGLAICKGIIERAGGKIWFESIENEGAIFYVSLPLSEEES